MSLKLSWRINLLKEVSHGDCWGLEMSQFECFSAVDECSRVLKGVNLNILVLCPNV